MVSFVKKQDNGLVPNYLEQTKIDITNPMDIPQEIRQNLGVAIHGCSCSHRYPALVVQSDENLCRTPRGRGRIVWVANTEAPSVAPLFIIGLRVTSVRCHTTRSQEISRPRKVNLGSAIALQFDRCLPRHLSNCKAIRYFNTQSRWIKTSQHMSV